jgi:hypothetical protein
MREITARGFTVNGRPHMFGRVVSLVVLGLLLGSVFYQPVMNRLASHFTGLQVVGTVAVGFAVWLFLLVVTIHSALRQRNPSLGRSHERETSLAGKAFGVMYPNLIVPVCLIFILAAIVFGLQHGVQAFLVVSMAVIFTGLSFAYLLQLSRKAMNRRSARRRPPLSDQALAESFGHLGERREALQAACSRIAAETGIPIGHLRATDRFGYELGTFSSLDPTLDRLARWLLDARAGEEVDVSSIKTLRDYVWAWPAASPRER